MADWDYILLKPAQRYLKRMPIEDQLRVIEALDQLIQDSIGLDIKPLKGRPESRLRIGKYRILFREDSENQIYVVTTIRPRGDVYK
ncbi:MULTISPECIES: type II toxin-antitoxin system RelE family toxin [Leptolyngbya]|uniref:type II toxin-antitoxin system RelE family toxin n=1 Tax=Leptolyngbya TaxID=47251 RepID=UPI0016887479|nr:MULTISPECIES: type II toxin-antitoxin system RelE/ParE family toxin [unclassified Leptolyngbya]MBD1854026.1 type II toxin-antitoxin system RelE/ParE family toxin [Leptolyngbya sp. FACHB-1624]MCY6493780.1 type II toxin-antitoxin system RelE/ParE family toxin [Leptolyngbya sp. GGD]